MPTKPSPPSTANSRWQTTSAVDYDAWYRRARGAWMAETEAAALLQLAQLRRGDTLLDVGCGSGWFSRRFAAAGAAVTGLDLDPAMLAYAGRHSPSQIGYVRGDMAALPFPDQCFDVVSAVTSLCFVKDERAVLREMRRVARRVVVLGLLHRSSLLYWSRRGRGSYRGARWHSRADIRQLVRSEFGPLLAGRMALSSHLFWPGSPALGARLERLPGLARHGGFLAVALPGSAAAP